MERRTLVPPGGRHKSHAQSRPAPPFGAAEAAIAAAQRRASTNCQSRDNTKSIVLPRGGRPTTAAHFSVARRRAVTGRENDNTTSSTSRNSTTNTTNTTTTTYTSTLELQLLVRAWRCMLVLLW